MPVSSATFLTGLAAGVGGLIVLVLIAGLAVLVFRRPPASAAAEPKDPPSGWFWKRLLAWAMIVSAHLSIGAVIWLMRDATALMWLGLALVGEAIIVFTFYFAGATLTDWAELAGKVAPGIKIGLGGVTAGPTPGGQIPGGPASGARHGPRRGSRAEELARAAQEAIG